MLGQTIANRYKITEEVNQDSLSVFCKAQDITENKSVFITILKEKAKQRPLETLLRFKREQEQLSKLNHPNLTKILSQGEFEGQDYVAKEYFDAILLSQFLSQPQNIGQPLSIDVAVEIILQISSALDLAHQSGILHQALQPQSILITQDAKNTKLSNFGYNLLIDISRITEPEEIISTFGYLSPESSGILRKPIDARSDIYSLGIIFYQLLTGRLPYIATDVTTLIHQHIAQVSDSPSKLNSHIPPVIENIVLRLIAKDPQDRYQSLTGLIADLKEYQKQRQEGKAQVDFEIARFDKLRQLSFSTRLIGRDRELNRLKSLLDQTRQGKGNLCFVFGEPGIGKSRLVDELRGHIHGLEGIFCGGKCYQYEFRTPYKVFAEAIDAYIEKVKRLSQEEQQEQIRRIKDTLGELGGEVVKIAPSITDLIGSPPKLVELEPEKEKIRFLITITNFLTSLSAPESPLLLFLDDLQWADDGTLEILERFADKLQNAATLLIVSYRDTEVPSTHPLAQLINKLKDQQTPLSEIPVRFFSLPEISQMISQIIMEKEEQVLPLAQELSERTKGNPFFTLELLHSLVDSKIIYLKESHYTYDLEQLKKANLPTTIVEAVLKRMKDLSEDSLKILSYGSVMGKEIQFSLLVDLTQQSQDQVLNSIENGIQNQLLYRDLTGQENIFFMHDRIREAFYQRVAEKERIPLHKHIAEVLEEQNKTNPAPVIYDLAYHFTKGQVENKALEYSMPAAYKAKSSYANTLAISLYNTVKEILEKQDKRESKEYIEILENLGEVYRLAAKFDDSLQVLKICESIIPKEEKMHKVKVLSMIGDTIFEKGELVNSTHILEQTLKMLGVWYPSGKASAMICIVKEFAEQMLHTLFPKVFISEKYSASERDLLIVRIYQRLAHIYYFFDTDMVLYCMLKSLNLSEKMGPCSELAYSYMVAHNAWATIPWFSRTLRDGNKGVKMAQDLGNRIRESCGFAFFAYSFYTVNRIKESFDYAQKAISQLKVLGEYWDMGVALVFRDHDNLMLGRIQEGIQENEEFIKLMKEAKSLQCTGWALLMKVKLLCFAGAVDDAGIVEDILECNRIAKQTNDRPNMMWSLYLLAFIYLRRNKYFDAVSKIDEAVALFPTHYNRAIYVFDIFPAAAQIYLDTIVNVPDLSKDTRKLYLKKARGLCTQSILWSFLFTYNLGWTLQVRGVYYWLTGRKRKAVRAWEKGLNWLRTNKNNPGGDKYRIAYILLEEAKFLLTDNSKDKKAYSNLIEARDLFTEMGCKLDLETATKLLETITPEGQALDSRTVLTQKRHLDSLLSVTQAIGSIFILDELLQKILEYGLKVTGAERGFLLLFDEKTKQLSLKVSHGLEKELQSLSFSYENYKLSLELINEVNNSKAAQIADPNSAPNPKIQAELKTFSIKQALVAYLSARDKPIGILYLDNRLAGGTFGKDELELMKGFAVQASVSIENAFLVSSLVEQERLKQELELGRQIQESLLPKESPVIPNLKLSGLMLPAKEIGGDYYDFVTPDEQKGPDSFLLDKTQSYSSVSIVIGDVSGKGVAAGLLMAMAKTAIHTLSQEETSPKQILLRTNQILVKHIGAQKFMTMLYFRYDTTTKTLTYSSAGHEHILIYRSSLNKVESILSGGFMLGMVPDIAAFLEDKNITLSQGDKIILYTDGVTEARNPNEDLFGLEKLIELIQKHGSKPAEQLLNSIKEEVYSYIGAREQYDDITLVVMEAT